MRKPLVLAVAAALAIPAGLAMSAPASAATGCSVAYKVSSQWGGGFIGDVTVTNLGDAVSSWTLTWTFPASGQAVTSAWNATVTQSGLAVTAKNASWNPSIATNGTASFGFQGAWTSSNPVPTSFALNGTTCTGSSSGGSTTTTTTRAATTTTTRATTTTTRPTTTTTSRTTTTTTRATTTTTGGSGTWAACTSDQWGTFTIGSYTLYNNIWGSGAGTQTLCQNSVSNWQVTANHPNTSGIKSYPNASITANRTLSSLSSYTTSFNVSVPSSGAYSTTYDLWANNNAYEIMVWVNKTGAVGPIAESYDANGAVPSASNVSLGGHTWNIYRGSNGANTVYSFIRTSNATSGTINMLQLLQWLRTNGWWGDVTLGAQQFGYEITSASGGLNFTTNSYSISYN